MGWCEVLAGRPLGAYLEYMVIIDLRAKCLKERIELATKETSRADAREEILSFVERRRDTSGGPRPMDLDNQETDQYPQSQTSRRRRLPDDAVEFWPEEGEWQEESNISQMNFDWGAGSGYGVNGKERGFGNPPGEKGGKKGWTKVKGKGRGKSVFQGVWPPVWSVGSLRHHVPSEG